MRSTEAEALSGNKTKNLSPRNVRRLPLIGTVQDVTADKLFWPKDWQDSLDLDKPRLLSKVSFFVNKQQRVFDSLQLHFEKHVSELPTLLSASLIKHGNLTELKVANHQTIKTIKVKVKNTP